MLKEAPLPSIQKNLQHIYGQNWSEISLAWLKACNSSITRTEKPLLDGNNISCQQLHKKFTSSTSPSDWLQ